jgi:hypothetical protein
LIWRRHPDLNRGIAVLQTAALPLGYAAMKKCLKCPKMSKVPKIKVKKELYNLLRQKNGAGNGI